MRRLPTKAELDEKFAYDPKAGDLIWRVSCGRAKAGDVAGYLQANGYRYVGINGRLYPEHRVIFRMVTGRSPKGQIDHINGIRDDNRWENLREVSRSENLQNQRKARSNNELGFLGVRRSRKRFRAQIWLNGKQHYLGTFDTPELAHQAYLREKRGLHSGCTI